MPTAMGEAMRLLLISNAKREGLGYLEHAQGQIADFLGPAVRRVAFVPYAAVRKTYDRYVEDVTPALVGFGGKEVVGIHAVADKLRLIGEADAIMVGGGNTWKLLGMMREERLLPAIRDRVRGGVPYLGWSAGSNVACPTIQTTNDMPIADAGGYDALGFVPFQINPHYLHGNPPGFKGETREDRILEYLELHRDVVVAGLREGTMLRVEDEATELIGESPCRIFRFGREPEEIEPGGDLSFLLRVPSGVTS
jgi:dipeptidase E